MKLQLPMSLIILGTKYKQVILICFLELHLHFIVDHHFLFIPQLIKNLACLDDFRNIPLSQTDALEGRNGGRDHCNLELSFTKIVLLVSIWKCTATNAVRIIQKPEIPFIAIVIVHISAAASFKRFRCFLSCMSFCKLKYMWFFSQHICSSHFVSNRVSFHLLSCLPENV